MLSFHYYSLNQHFCVSLLAKANDLHLGFISPVLRDADHISCPPGGEGLFCSVFPLTYIGMFLRHHVICFYTPGELADSGTIAFLLGQMCSPVFPHRQEAQEIMCLQ